MKHLRFIALVVREHYGQFFQVSIFGGILGLLFEAALYGAAGFWIYDTYPDFDSGVVGSLLSAISLFASLLIAVLVLLHEQVNKETSSHSIDIDQGDSQVFPKNIKLGMVSLLRAAKAKTIKGLFNDISFCLLLCIVSAFLMVLSMVAADGIKTLANCLFVAMGIKILLVIYEFCRKLYYLLNDDFAQAAKSA